jgi:glycosyltransferase involved in cell wall biosynthesis
METRTRLGIPLDALIVGTVANIIPVKGIEFFIRAAEVVYRKHPNVWFLVVGASLNTHLAYAQQLRAQLARSSLPKERFIFAGSASNLESWYPAMDVKVIASRSEATPTTAIEAMACGVPVVATDVGGVREVVVNGVTGLVVPPLSGEAIGEAVIRLLDRPGSRREFGLAGRSRAVEIFDVEICADTHVRAFEAAVANHVPRAKPRVSGTGNYS